MTSPRVKDSCVSQRKTGGEKSTLLEEKTHRVTAEQAVCLRRAAIVVSWVSTVVSIVLAFSAIGFAVTYGTQSLFGFGLDALLDSLSSIIILWRFHGQDIYSEIKELRACLMIGVLFVMSSIILAGMSIEALVSRDPPDESEVAAILSSINTVMCVVLGTLKVVIGFKLESRAIIIDSVITFTGAAMAIFSFVFAAVYSRHPTLWYLDDVFGIICSLFLCGYGLRIVVLVGRDMQKLAEGTNK